MSEMTNPFADPSQPTLQAALDKALQGKAVPEARIARLRAAVAAFARLMQRPATELPAHQGFVIHQMRRLRSLPTGLSRKTLSNTRSELLYLIATVRGRGPRSSFPLSEHWARFRTALGPSPDWWSLSRLAGFSSRQNVKPSEVCDAHVKHYVEALRQAGEVADAAANGRRVIRVWNKLAANYPALQIRPLTLAPQQRKRWTLPETAFPQSFRSDVEAWFRRLTSDDPFGSGPRRPLQPSTIRTRRHQLFKAASALVLAGKPIESVRCLGDLVTLSAFQTLMRYLLDRQGGKSTEALHGLATGLLAVARHHVAVDRETEARLARIVKNLDPNPSGFRSKTRTRLAAFENDRHVAALLRLPSVLLAEAKAARSMRRRKHLAQMAAAIEILTFAPLRIGNLVSLRLGVSLRQATLGRQRRWLISIPPSEVKNRSELVYELPENTAIDDALALYEQPDGWLFPGRAPTSKARSLLSRQIKSTIENRLGLPFHPHLFRALAGYLHLRENPNGFEAVRALLGNRDDKVIRENYAFLAERSLVAHAQACIGRARARLGPDCNSKRATT